MPNLVGIGNSQVPTNAMLGGLAYQDSISEVNFDKIKAKASGSATDIFVYDTRKDSDGGAWRHRTQNTSWYNEGVSETRGARKEFPAVALIVAEQNFITIYDGDDPNLPMWMVFNTIVNGNSQGMADRPMIQIQDVDKFVHMLNGILVTGTKNEGSNYGQPVINFINERVLRMDSQGGEGGEWIGNIAQRNEALGYKHTTNDYVIKASHINDVAMTVLPNAPTDETTGLPIPTIGVATPDGVSIIKEDGSVVDIKGTHGGGDNDTQFVDFDSKTNAVISGFDYGGSATNAIYKLHVFPIPSTDITENTAYNAYQNHHRRVQTGTNITIPKFQGNYLRDAISAGGNGRYAIRTGDSPGTGYAAALNIMQEEPGTDGSNTNFPSNSRIAYIAKDYNTGWMHGDIKGAFLSNTVSEKDGVNYALSAEFDGTNRLSSHTYSNGALSWQMVDNSGSANGYVVVAFKGLTVGQRYKISMTWNNNATLDSGYAHRIVHQNGTSAENNTNFDHWNKTNGSSETLTGVFTAQSANNDDLAIYANAITLNISNFKIEETDDVGEYGDGLGQGDNGNLIKNPGPNFSNTSGWGATNGSLSVSSGDLLLTGANNINEHMYSSGFTLIDGKTYVLTVDSNQIFTYCRIGSNTALSTSEQLSEGVGSGLNSFTFTASATGLFYLKLGMTTNYVTGSINSVSLRLAEEDRCQYHKGLQIYGTVPKQPVATGAELLSYGPFSTSNRLQQPYNGQLQFGTGQFSVMFWFKSTASGSEQFIRKGDPSNDVGCFESYITAVGGAGNIRFVIKHTDGSSNTVLNSATQGYNNGVWNHYVGVRRSNNSMELYLNGELSSSTTTTHSVTNSSSILDIGSVGSVANGAANTFLSLIRISGSAPSAEQIKKMYYDEKCLFHENAKCALYGTSNNITAIAYDDTSNILHAGTSSGRSDFLGLNRINNTTTAVTTAISASDGFVAEQ